PWPGTSTSIVATTWLVVGSIRDTVPSPWFRTQSAPSPAARNRGDGPTRTLASTLLVAGSIRETTDWVVLLAQTAPKPATTANEPGGTVISVEITFRNGSI